jgi:hypothetical protein
MKKLKLGLVVLVAVSALGLNSASADQPRMHAALRNLRAARAELEHAEHNKGGWRERALEHVDRAIHEVENGMAVAR